MLDKEGLDKKPYGNPLMIFRKEPYYEFILLFVFYYSNS